MKKNIIYISVLAFALLLSACERVEEIDAPVSGKMEEMKFFASIESGADTKTMIDGNVGDETRYLKWLPEDAIGVYNKSSKKFEKFVNVNTETSASGVFEGENTVQDVYYAVYPYSELHSYADRDKIMTVDLPAVQNYAENTFGNGANPMVAHAESGEELNFQNLCGVLVINLTGSVTVKSMSVTLLDETGNLAPVSGKHTVSMDYIEEPSLNSTEESTRSVTLDCGEGVALNSAEPTPFHIVVPAGTYNGITLSVVTADGQMMVKHGQNQLKIRRRRVTSAGALGWETVVAVDLSERGTSNCYIVSEPGAYSFDATVIGNGEFGLIPDRGFHTADVNIDPSVVELLWEDVPGLVQSVYCVNGRAGFYSSGKEGNAVLVAKDASGTIMWSWHIWFTDNPVEQIYVNDNGTFTVMDRNIGAIRADRGYDNEWEQSVGMLYQWGRKDPLYKDIYTAKKGMSTIEETIQSPDSHASLGGWSYNSHWEKNHNNYLWDSQQKTIYDPCPVGYMVADINAYYDLSVTEEFDNGYYASSGESSKLWFPVTPMIHCGGGYVEADSEVVIWSSGITASGSFRRLHIKNNDDGVNYWEGMDNAAMTSPVRCMKDEGFVDRSLPQAEVLEISEVTTNSAKVVAGIKSFGLTDITEKGVIYSTKADLSDAVKVKCATDNGGEYTCSLDGLVPGTVYYIKAYAANLRGTAYENIGKVFSTSYSDDIVNLSASGTANSYIVPPLKGIYSFACDVKGNSMKPVGVPHSIEVLWETLGCSSSAEAGSIISSVKLMGGSTALLELVEDGQEGNALIAVKDANGTILWSWHIWITDEPDEQIYQNSAGTFSVLDRNLGATRADRGEGDEWLDSRGLVYFWGRKDPFWYNSYTRAKGPLTLEQAISNPAMMHQVDTWVGGLTSWLGESMHIPTLWMYDNKTQYDPCPPGYRVAVNDIWSGFTTTGTSSENSVEFNVKGEFSNGWEFYIDDTKTTIAWYPAMYWMHWAFGYESFTNEGSVWSANYILGSNKYCLSYNNEMVNPQAQQSDGHGLPVRCMKE